MYTEYFVGFLFGMVAMLCLMKIAYLLEPDEEQKDIPVPVFYDTRLCPTKIVSEKTVYREEVAIYVDSYWKERALAEVKDKLAVEVLKHAKFEFMDDPKNCAYKMHGEVMVFTDKPHLALNNDSI